MAIDPSNGKEILDATQTLVINAAENAAQLIENTAEELHGYEEFYQSPEFWVAVSFVLAVGLLLKPVGKLLRQMLIKRIDTITSRITEAADLKDDAQKLLVDYEQKYLQAEKEAKNILRKSKKEVELIKEESLNRLKEDMAVKTKEAESRITAAQDEALKEISALASELTIKTVKQAVIDNLDTKTQDRLIDNSIRILEKI